MTTVIRLSNCRICVFGGQSEHPPPHFHLMGPNTNCTIDLVSLKATRGKYARADLNEALDWLSVPENYRAVVAEWRRLNERE